MDLSIFLNTQRKLRNVWWLGIFFLVLAAITFPLILLSQRFHFAVTMMHQSVIIIVTSLICQLLRRKPLTELFGGFNLQSLRYFCSGSIIGAVLMLIPSLILMAFGWLSWQNEEINLSLLFEVSLLFAGVALAEEVLFRGFIFQRLIEGIGQWPAQFIISGYFLLIHLNNPGMDGNVRIIATINIFLASLMFGLAFIRTKSLAMPIGIHFMANWVQGVLLGFGVSGNQQASFLKPVFHAAPDWLTGGPFGLEASLPGLIAVIITIIYLYRIKPREKQMTL